MNIFKKKKYVAFMVGDENIGLGGLVAFHSFNKHNPNIDMKMYTYVDKLDNVIKTELEKINVELIDIQPLLSRASIFSNQSINGLNWPKEVFVNYMIPEITNKKYEYSIKLDYDILVINPLDLDEIKPKNEILSTINNTFTCYSMNRIGVNETFYKNQYDLDIERTKNIGVNSGVLIFNNKKFYNNNIFDNMINIYLEIQNIDHNAFSSIYCDQGLINLVLEINKMPYKLIPTKYNLTTSMFRVFDEDCVTILHYTGSVKPWKKFDISEKHLETWGHANVFMAYYWDRYVSENLPSMSNYFENDFDDKFILAAVALLQNRDKYKNSNKK